MTKHKNNEGGTKLVPATSMTKGLNQSISGDPVLSTTLHQLLHFTQASSVIIKIDIEVNMHMQLIINHILKLFICRVLSAKF